MATRTATGQTYTPTTTTTRPAPQVEGLPPGVYWTSLPDGTRVRSDDPRARADNARQNAETRANAESGGVQGALTNFQNNVVEGVPNALGNRAINTAQDARTAINVPTQTALGVAGSNIDDPGVKAGTATASRILPSTTQHVGVNAPPPPPPPAPPGTPAVVADPKAAADAEAARQLRDQLAAERAGLKPGTAPQVGALAPINAAQAGGPQQVQATNVDYTQINPIERYWASTVAQTPGAVARDPRAAQMNLDAQGQFRDEQAALQAGLHAAAFGIGGPSAAQAILQRGNEEAIAAQFALAGTQHGYGAGAALRAAGRNAAALQGKAALDAAQLRAVEQQQARGQLITATGQGREQDIDIAKTQAGFEQQSGIVGAQLGTQVSISNADRDAARAMKQADLEQAAAAGNAAAQNELNNRQAALNQQANLANQEQGLRASIANQDAQLKTDLANAGFTQQAILQMSDQDLKRQLANAGFQLTQQQIDELRRSNITGETLQAHGQLLNYDTNQKQIEVQRAQLLAQAEAARRAGNMQMWAMFLQMAGALGGALI